MMFFLKIVLFKNKPLYLRLISPPTPTPPGADFGDLRGFIYMIDIDFAVYYSLSNFWKHECTRVYQTVRGLEKLKNSCRSINPADFYFDNRHTYKFNKYFNFSSNKMNMNFYWYRNTWRSPPVTNWRS